MSDPLSIYLDDHLAGSSFAIELLESMRDRFQNQPLGEFAEALLADVREDQQVLRRIMERVGKSGLELKTAVGWVAEKLSRMKLHDDDGAGLGTLETIETLTLGILGKAALWNVLEAIRDQDPRVGNEDFAQLGARARAQHARAEEQRLQLARKIFGPVAEVER